MEFISVRRKLELAVVAILLCYMGSFINGARRTKVRLRGPPGMPGLPGPKGKRGWIGQPGRSGRVGEPGPAGRRGTQGVQGIEGLKGYQGQIGADGRAGPAGPPFSCSKYYKQIDCAVGLTGYSGPHGPSGDKGKFGPRGHKGEMGHEGSVGRKGKRGRSGRPGSRGLLTEIECRTGQTRFMKPMRFKKGRHSFGCNETNIEFLKGFEIEANGEKIRYKYRCCWFINVFR